MENNFKIKKDWENSITIEKDGLTFNVTKGPDNDIWFNSINNIKMSISFYSINEEEWQSYIIFENLMKFIIGRYILNGDDKNKYSNLPKDFIDLENKTITWHSDSKKDDILQLKYEKNTIIVSITRDKNNSNRLYNNPIKVRIRTNGSDYENYYQEFEKFFNELSSFAYQIELINKKNIPTNGKQKKLSLFDDK